MNISRNYHRGKSFRFSNWCPGITYKNDDYVQDFVKYKNSLYACEATHTTKFPDKSTDWELVIECISGENGVDGVSPQLKIEDGFWFVSHDNGDNWTNIGKAVGENGLSAYQIWLNAGNSGTELDFLNSLKNNSAEQTAEWGFWKN